MIDEQSRAADAFIAHWSSAPISERAHYQTFIVQLCRLLEVSAPDDEQAGDLNYCFERPVRFVHEDGSSQPGYIDCAKKGCFVLEAKQSRKRRDGGALDASAHLTLLAKPKTRTGAPSSQAVDQLMRNAKRQAENYAKALAEWPPFLVVVDVGRSIELWSDFARQGKIYAPFPDRANYRIHLDDLRDPAVRERLRKVWTDPLSLDPASKAAEVTTGISTLLAAVVRSINGRRSAGLDSVGVAAQAGKTALFVMQCIFAMFADSVGLIEDRKFLKMLESHRGDPAGFHEAARNLFQVMHRGGYCLATHSTIRWFNGGLFRTVDPIPVTEEELAALIEAASCDWANVEPAIFGALLEQALEPGERAELGAHYTPRAFVERLVEPTIMEPLRADWEAAEVEAIGLYLSGSLQEARKTIHRFHSQLCKVRVLDPACGTGNFLYVAMRMMKELEEEVLSTLGEIGDHQGVLAMEGHAVSPEQFYGLEKNANAAWIAELVMWIGYLQWHFRMSGRTMPAEPILKDFRTIECADALLQWSRTELDRSWRFSPAGAGSVTPPLGAEHGERDAVHYVNPRERPWPSVHFIVGNPPFIGGKDLRRELGDGYVEALAAVRGGRFRSADLVTAWWDRAARELTREGTRLRRFGFITTNSITQTFSRRVLEHHLQREPAMRIVFAIADHPWIRGQGCADVRIAMSVVERGEPDGQAQWLRVRDETTSSADAAALKFEEHHGVIGADLALNSQLTTAAPLLANAGLAYRGVQLMGAGFLVDRDRGAALLLASRHHAPSPLRQYRNGRDLADRCRDLQAIDLFGLDDRTARQDHPLIYQHLLETVKPERDRNKRAAYRDAWWIFGEPRRDLREALAGLSRYIVTVETAKHRWFRFLDSSILPDNKLVVIASDDPAVLAVLSSRQHRAWFAANAGRIGEYEREAVYVKSACFDRFPFPDMTAKQRAELGALAEELDALRARVLDGRSALTMTKLYNARSSMTLDNGASQADREVYEIGCVGLIDHLHRRIDGLVADAYGWPEDLSDRMVVARLVELNRERSIEEAAGVVRFLRPERQAMRRGSEKVTRTTELAIAAPETPVPLPQEPVELASTLLSMLRRAGVPLTPDALATAFDAKPTAAKRQIQQTLAVLSVGGVVQQTDAGWFAPRRRPN